MCVVRLSEANQLKAEYHINTYFLVRNYCTHNTDPDQTKDAIWAESVLFASSFRKKSPDRTSGLSKLRDIKLWIFTIKILQIGTPNIITAVTLKWNSLFTMHCHVQRKQMECSDASKRCQWNGKKCRSWSDCSMWSSLIWVFTVCPCLPVPILTIFMVW